MKTIAHIITGLNAGGAERALITLLTGGVHGPFRNVVISMMGEGHYGPMLREAGIRVYCLGMKQGHIGLSALMRLRSVMAQECPDLLQGWMYHGNFLATVAQAMTCRKVKLVWNVRTSLDAAGDMSPGSRAMISVGRWLSSRPDAIIYNSRKSYLQHRKRGFSDKGAIVLPNAFDLQKWKPSRAVRRDMREELGYKDTDLILGYIGRNNIMKDPENLFAALQIVFSQNSKVHVVIAGHELEVAAPKGIGGTGRVQFLGKRSDIPRLMPAFDLLCLSSRVEGFPNVIGEAMACCVPCVSTDVGDVAGIIGGTGWIARPRNSLALAEALVEALNEPPEKLRKRGMRARQLIAERYSSPAIVAQYVGLYQRCLQMTNGRPTTGLPLWT